MPGTRWISDTEPELGLGTVLRLDERRVEVYFGTIEESRVYAIGNTPLTRVQFTTGDSITDRDDQEWEVVDSEMIDDLIIYFGRSRSTPASEASPIPETSLSDFIQLSDARSRLFSGQLDDGKWFDLRRNCLDQIHNSQINAAFGLTGARITPVPHQLYIANEVAQRQSPRVLLADEVGLGKTIEACLILHHQILVGRTNRALIIVPDPLLNQWLVELRRRFNLSFSLFDEERYRAIVEEDPDVNPFESEQLILSSLATLLSADDVTESVFNADWDMLIVDEAHHIEWSESAESPEYEFINRLSLDVSSVLLLTATPESLGPEGHFARLKLLDPNRFHDLPAWVDEQRKYQRTSELAAILLDNEKTLEPSVIQELEALIGATEITQFDDNTTRHDALNRLLDQHGTSRVMFRNSRSAIKGFPSRIPKLQQLESVDVDPATLASLPVADLALPECVTPSQWPRDDERVSWLIGLLEALSPQKVLVICARAETAIALEEELRVRTGFRAGLFHEGLTVIARDRAAAWFAEPSDHARALISSEIGSEGRNFQFAAHLVLFDLPMNPDLLEQRIGRLDRIGQSSDIEIHVPVIPGQPMAVLARVYNKSLTAFNVSSPVGGTVFHEIAQALEQGLRSPADTQHIDTLVDTAATVATTQRELVETGRDRLLEISSFDDNEANALKEAFRISDEQPGFPAFVERLLDTLGVDVEDDEHGVILHPSPRMQVQQFPGIPDGGQKCTFDRDFALTHEDQAFLTPEHPIVRDAIDMVLLGQQGRAAMVALPINVLPTGTLLVETLHVLEIRAAGFDTFRRFFPNLSLHQLVATDGRDLTRLTTTHVWPEHFKDLDQKLTRVILRNFREKIRSQIDKATLKARASLMNQRDEGLKQFQLQMKNEIHRLTTLRKTNPNVRIDEIETLTQLAGNLTERIHAAPVRLDAVRIHVVP